MWNNRRDSPFALIPGAGRSRRMGTPKLLLPIAGRSVVAHLLDALAAGGIDRRFVVVHPEDARLAEEVARHGGQPIVPDEPPPEMVFTIRAGLDWIRSRHTDEPMALDMPWLLVPADHPGVIPETIEVLRAVADRNPGRILIPTHSGRRGHPTVFAWKHALAIDAVPNDQGFNWIVRQYATDVLEIPVTSEGVLLDLDTPADYERLQRLWTL